MHISITTTEACLQFSVLVAILRAWLWSRKHNWHHNWLRKLFGSSPFLAELAVPAGRSGWVWNPRRRNVYQGKAAFEVINV